MTKKLILKIKDYLSLVKFSHTVFAMPFALIGFVLGLTEGEGSFNWQIFILIILCMISARNAAMGFNRIADRYYDALNPRTSSREIPSGIIKVRSAVFFVIINSLLFILSAGLINRLTLFLSPLALAIILGYSLTKRFTWLCHFILGLGLSLAPTGAYISVTGQFRLIPVMFSLMVLTWVSGFDIIYSLQDDQFDRENRLFSIPSVKGRKLALTLSGIIHSFTLMFVLIAGFILESGIFYWAGSALFILLLVYQHLIVKPDDISRVNLAFSTLNGIGSIIFAFFVIADLFYYYGRIL